MMRQISLLPEVDLLSIDVAVVPFEVLTSLLQMLRKKPRALILKNARNTDTEISALRDYEQHCFNKIQTCPSHLFIYLVNINRFHESTSFPKSLEIPHGGRDTVSNIEQKLVVAICAPTRSVLSWVDVNDSAPMMFLVPSITRYVSEAELKRFDIRLYLGADEDDDFWIIRLGIAKTSFNS